MTSCRASCRREAAGGLARPVHGHPAMVADEPQYSNALVLFEGEDAPRALSLGDTLEGREVVSIETDRIRVRAGARYEELLLQP